MQRGGRCVTLHIMDIPVKEMDKDCSCTYFSLRSTDPFSPQVVRFLGYSPSEAVPWAISPGDKPALSVCHLWVTEVWILWALWGHRLRVEAVAQRYTRYQMARQGQESPHNMQKDGGVRPQAQKD